MKRLSIVLAVLFVMLLLVIVYVTTQPESPLTQQITQLTEPKKVISPPKNSQTTYQKLAAGILEWIGHQRDNRGLFVVSRSCRNYPEAPGTCDTVLLVNNSAHSGIPALWARYLYDTKVGGILSKELHDDVASYYNFSKANYIQTDLWSCKLFSEMAKDNRFSSEEKAEMQELCVKHTGYNEIGEVYYYVGGQNVGDVQRKIVGYAPDFSENIVNLGKLPVDSKVEQFWDMTSAYPSDLVARYQWTQDPIDLKLAEAYMWETMNFYQKEAAKFSQDNYCSLGYSALDLYLTTQNKDYLEVAKKIITDRIATEKEGSLYSPICGLWLKQMYQVTKDASLPSYVQAIANHMISEDLDLENSGRNMLNDGAYLTPSVDGGKGLVKSVRDNGLAAAFLLQL